MARIWWWLYLHFGGPTVVPKMGFVNEIFFFPLNLCFGNLVGIVTDPQIVLAISGIFRNWSNFNGNIIFVNHDYRHLAIYPFCRCLESGEWFSGEASSAVWAHHRATVKCKKNKLFHFSYAWRDCVYYSVKTAVATVLPLTGLKI